MQPRTDEDGYDLKFVLWNNLDNGLFGAIARCAKVVDTVASLLGKFDTENFQEGYVRQSIQEWTKENLWKTAFKKFEGICGTKYSRMDQVKLVEDSL